MARYKQEMEIMHIMCQKEVQELQLNLSKFLLESERMQKILIGRKTATENDGIVPSGGGDIDGAGKRINMFTLIAFDRYMSQVCNVVNMARKFNIHLKLNKLTNAVMNPVANNCMAQSHMLQEYIEWNNTRLERDVANEGETNEDIDLEITESLTWKNDNILKTSQKEGIFNKKSLEANQILHQFVEDVKNVERNNEEKRHEDIMAKLDDFLKIILPTKNLSEFKEGHEFSGSITYVQDYKALVFFICELSDSKFLSELSRTENLTSISRSSLSEAVFCVSQNKSENDGVWRAVMVPEESNDVPDAVYLIDLGEIMTLTNQSKLYRIPLEHRHIYPLAIKCIMKGVYNCQTKLITRDHAKCEQVLRCAEYKMAQFHVVEQQNRVLHLVFVEKTSNEISKKEQTISKETETCKTISKTNINPFLNTSFLFDDDDKDLSCNLDPLPLPLSTVYSAAPAPMPSLPTTPSLNVTAQLGDKLKILVTHIVNPITFYAIIEGDSYDYSKAFSWPDHEIARVQKQMPKPQINDFILAIYIKDGYWYRARVIDVVPKTDLYKVFYVDFGNTDIVPIYCLAKCCKQHLEDPLRAVLFRLANLSIPKDNDKNDGTLLAVDVRLQKAIETVVVLILDQTLNVEVVDRHEDELVIRLIDQQYADLPKILFDMGGVKEV